MKNKRIDIPELKSYYCNQELRCVRCHNKMLLGVQYFASKKSYIDLTCIGCARGVDVELKELNSILIEFNFKPVKERYVTAGQDY
ncbi:MAG: hypothetical protein RI886_1289 [Pseudomonadota bacterium]|jgi:hypothetical protein